MKQDSTTWKFRTQNLVAIYTLTLRKNFGSILGVHFRHTIYCSKAHEVKSPTLQTVCKSKLKLRSYGHLKTTAQT